MAALKSKYDEAADNIDKFEATTLEQMQKIQAIEKELAISQAENKRSQSQIIEHKQIIAKQQKSLLEANTKIGKLEEMSKQLKAKYEEITCN